MSHPVEVTYERLSAWRSVLLNPADSYETAAKFIADEIGKITEQYSWDSLGGVRRRDDP